MTSQAASTATLESEVAPELDSSLEPAPAGYARVLLFSLAGRTHCAFLGSVREILPLQAATPLSGAAVHVRGLINLRGNIVTVLDATMCEYGVAAADASASILLVERGSRVAGVVVDEVHDIGLLGQDRGGRRWRDD